MISLIHTSTEIFDFEVYSKIITIFCCRVTRCSFVQVINNVLKQNFPLQINEFSYIPIIKLKLKPLSFLVFQRNKTKKPKKY